jgi:alpha-mannosidase
MAVILQEPGEKAAKSGAGEGNVAAHSLVASFHYDVAYLETFESYLPQCFKNLDEVLRILEAEPEYRFLVEQVILLEAYWEARPEARDALRRFAREGRLEVAPGMFVMPDLNHPSGEAIFRQIETGFRWLGENLGIRPTVCYIADCWGHPPQLPQLLQQCGYTHYIFWRCMRPDVARTSFRWCGLDGTILPTCWLPFGYGTVRCPDSVEAVNALDLKLASGSARGIAELAERLGKFAGDDPLLFFNGGDMAFPQAAAADLIRHLREAPHDIEIAFTTLAGYLDSIPWQDRPEVGGEFNSSLQGTFTTNIRLKQLNRELTNRLISLEALEAVRQRSDVSPHVASAWRLILKQQFHDIICGTITDDALRDALTEYDVADQSIEAGFRACNCPGGTDAFFNPLPFARRERVETDGRPALVDLPPMGFARPVLLSPQPVAPALPCTMESEFYTVRIGEDGYLRSLIEKTSGVELVSPGPAPFGSLALQMDYGDSWVLFDAPLAGGSMASAFTDNKPDPYDRSCPDELTNRSTLQPRMISARALPSEEGSLLIEQSGELRFWRIVIPFTTRILLRSDSPRIEFRTKILPTGRNYRIRAAFPSTLADGAFRREVAFGISDCPPGEHICQHWADLANHHAGLALLNRGTPGVSCHEGVLLLSLFRSAAMEYKTESALSFQEGIPHTFTYAIVPHAPGAEAQLVREGQVFNFPPIRCEADPTLPGNPVLSLEGAALSSLRPNQNGWLVRLYEPSGHPAIARLHLPPRFASWQFADAFGAPIGHPRPFRESFELPLKAFEIAHIHLQKDQ